jgi:tRNA (guanine37-N1)-methyltransferase
VFFLLPKNIKTLAKSIYGDNILIIMNFHIITLFPEAFNSYFESSIIKRAIDDNKIKVYFYNPRDYSDKKSKSVDNKPYGGGPGMVINAEPILKAIAKAKGKKKKVKIVHLSPGGKDFNTKYAEKLEKRYNHIIIICGRYEGIDARVKKIFKGDELSIGDYILTGGELPAMVILDTVSRFVPGVLGTKESNEEFRISNHNAYTRPETLKYKGKNYKVPKVLLEGNHKLIDEWRSSK